MKKTRKFQTLAARVLVPAIALFAFTQCNEESKIEKPIAEETEETTAAAEESEAAPSLTIDGIHTVVSSTVDCKTCDYIVPANATVVDGKELKIKPGQAICLDAAIRYGNLKFINLEGEAEKPIVIAYGVRSLKDPETVHPTLN
jgi:hypothetical protein